MSVEPFAPSGLRGLAGVSAHADDRLLDWGERAFLLCLYVGFAKAVLGDPNPISLSLLGAETLAVIFVLRRRIACTISRRPLHWAVALAGTLTPMLLRPGGDGVVGPLSFVMAAGGLFLVTTAKLSLNRRLGMAPANRGVQVRWSYAFVRHPLYLGFFIAQAGFLLQNPTPWNGAVLLLSWGLQIVRIGHEETHLRADPLYQAYVRRVRYRLIPGVY